jgi:outer membrane protein assembly factor BamB
MNQPILMAVLRLHDVSWSTPAVSAPLASGQRVVITADRSGTVHAFDGSGNDKLWHRKLEGIITASPVFGDINNDGETELVIGTESGWLYALAIDSGEILWKTRCGNCIRATAALADFDDDSTEVFVGGYGPWMFCLDGTSGKIKWKRYLPKHEFFGSTKAGIVSSPLVADVDLDGEAEIITGMRSRRVYCMRRVDGAFKWFRELKYDPDSSASFAMVNGQPVVYIGGGEHPSGKGENALVALRGYDGSVLWKSPVYGGLDSSPIIADINGDGRLEVVITSLADASSHAFDADSGRILWSYRFGPTDTCTHDRNNICRPLTTSTYRTGDAICRSYTTPLLADINNDGNIEVVVGSNNGTVAILAGATGKLIVSIKTKAIIRGSAVLADIDMDGSQELLITSGDRILVYKTAAREGEWPMFKGTTNHLGWLKPAIPVKPVENAPHQRYLWLKLIWYWWIKDSFRYITFRFDRHLLGRFSKQLLDYYY